MMRPAGRTLVPGRGADEPTRMSHDESTRPRRESAEQHCNGATQQHGEVKTIRESDEELVYHARCRLAEAGRGRAEARRPLCLPPGSGRNQPEPRHTME